MLKQTDQIKAAHVSGKTSYNVLLIVSIDYIWTVEHFISISIMIVLA